MEIKTYYIGGSPCSGKTTLARALAEKKGCSDKKQAFSNWMERDALFADTVQKQCEEAQYPFVRIREEKQLQEMQSSFFSGIFK